MRHMLLLSALVTLLAVSLSWPSDLAVVAAPLAATLPNQVASGDITATSAVLWARASTTGSLTFRYGLTPELTAAQTVTVAVAEVWQPAKVELTGLSPATRYYYQASDAAGARASGQFVTAAAAGTRRGLRFGVSGDWRGELAPYPAIHNAPGRNLDFFVLHGDTIYADFPSPAVPLPKATTLAEFRLKYDEVYGERFGRNSWGELRSLTAVFATIDDHEVINDFAGGAYPATDPRFSSEAVAFINETTLYTTAMQAFQEYKPLRDEQYGATGDPRTAGKLRLYRSRQFDDDAAIFVLDNRSFRDRPLPNVTNPNDPAQITAFLAASFDPNRTMLGAAQLADLKRDLLAAEQAGVTWKFVLVPEPIQNLGPLNAADRFEGYAAERTAILSFINEQQIRNVVFVAADIHGTVVNNLSYHTSPDGPQIATGAFEITTGAVAYDAPFGPTLMRQAFEAGLINQFNYNLYLALPRTQKDSVVATAINQGLQPFGYPPLGLQNSPITATLTAGSYVAVHTYGWTEFVIDPATRVLRVTTYGIDAYTQAQIEANPTTILARMPEVVSDFTVIPVLLPDPDPDPERLYLPLVRR